MLLCAHACCSHTPCVLPDRQVRAGVPISCVSLPFNLLDTSAADTALLDLCRQHSIKVGQTDSQHAHLTAWCIFDSLCLASC
jgi:hypothetical protein